MNAFLMLLLGQPIASGFPEYASLLPKENRFSVQCITSKIISNLLHVHDNEITTMFILGVGCAEAYTQSHQIPGQVEMASVAW